MRIGTRDTADAVVIVAEIGNNHEGDFELAERLVEKAGACGADAVKFQTARAELFIAAADRERLARFRSYEFSAAQWARLASLAKNRGLAFVSTPLDLESATMLTPLVDAFKIASGDITFLPLIDYVASTRVPVLLSTGASAMLDVTRALGRLLAGRNTETRRPDIAVLHCVSGYPTPPEEANLGMIPALARQLNVTIGYSDHVAGLDAAVAAVAAGARVVEKHFTIDKRYSAFRDHALSADPGEFRLLVRRVRAVEAMLGSGEKTLQPSEQSNAVSIRRSIAASRDLTEGHELSRSDIMWVRPATGLPPGAEERLMGKRLTRAIQRGELLTEADVV